jgi:parallel beta-helix repeat protein
MKKTFSLIILLVLFINALQINANIGIGEEIEVKKLYVDDDGDKDYTSIKDAINNASKGDTIFVFNGYYEGYFSINKSLTLQGENKNNTIIDGSNYFPNSTSLIKITADNVTLKGFNIQNSKRDIGMIIDDSSPPFSYYDYGIGIEIISDYNKISDNIIQKSEGYAILLNKSKYTTITNNKITNNKEVSIYLKNSSKNQIYINNITNNQRGIIFHIKSTENIIYLNNFINNSYYQAYDESNNSFYNTNIKKGNYWNDYNGIDSNDDGIGDTPYEIPGGISIDIYPLLKPYEGEKPFIIDSDQLFKMLTIGMIIVVIICIPIAYYWRKKYYT